MLSGYNLLKGQQRSGLVVTSLPSRPGGFLCGSSSRLILPLDFIILILVIDDLWFPIS